jgi:hypothetical protein
MRSTKEWIDWLKEIADVNGFKSFAEAAKHVEQLQARCVELERERVEVARKAFVAGANWWAQCELNDTLHSDEHKAAIEYAQREYGIKEQQ